MVLWAGGLPSCFGSTIGNQLRLHVVVGDIHSLLRCEIFDDRVELLRLIFDWWQAWQRCLEFYIAKQGPGGYFQLCFQGIELLEFLLVVLLHLRSAILVHLCMGLDLLGRPKDHFAPLRIQLLDLLDDRIYLVLYSTKLVDMSMSQNLRSVTILVQAVSQFIIALWDCRCLFVSFDCV